MGLVSNVVKGRAKEEIQQLRRKVESKPATRAEAFDTDRVTTPFIQAMKKAGFNTAIRYYNFNINKKVLQVAEKNALHAAGMDIVTCFQTDNTPSIKEFSRDKGEKAGGAAFVYASRIIQQPKDSAIYFSVDINADEGQITGSVFPFFDGVKSAMSKLASDDGIYEIGVYGNGLTCQKLLDAGKVTYTWLSMSKDFNGTKDYNQKGKWNLRQHGTIDLNEAFHYDPDFIGTTGCGAFGARPTS